MLTAKKTSRDETRQEPSYDRETLLQLYHQMQQIRLFEERVVDLYTRALIPGIAHVSIGQEAVPVGICAALRKEDYITSTHRGHGHCLAKGAHPDRMFAELFGKSEGYCRGKGGSMHIADPETGNLGANAIVGGGIAIATGAALSAKLQKNGRVAACFFGDGASNEGLLHESMNMASIWKLPVIYVCENNQYGEYTRADEVTGGDLVERGKAMGIASEHVNGMDVLLVLRAALQAVKRARDGGGPSFLVCETYRYLGHGMSDRDRPYRERSEEDAWRARDPIQRLDDYLIQQKIATQDELKKIVEQIHHELEEAVEFGKASPLPKPEEVRFDVYAS